MTNKLNITWRDVLDCKMSAGYNIEQFIPLVMQMRYQYFNWNGRVYKPQLDLVKNKIDYVDTSLTTDDL